MKSQAPVRATLSITPNITDPSDFDFRLVERIICDTNQQHFGIDTGLWRWVLQPPIFGKPGRHSGLEDYPNYALW